MSNRLDSTIAGASIIIVVFAVLSRGLGFFREVIFASVFGTGKEFDLYLVGAVLPLTIHTILLYVGQNFFIPVYHHITGKIPTEQKKFIFPVIIIFFLIGIIISVLLFLSSGTFINAYISDAGSSEILTATNIFRIFLLSVPLSAVNSILIAYLQANFRFSIPAKSTLFLNITIIIFVLSFRDNIGIYSISYGFVAGVFLQLLFLLFKSKIYFFLKDLSRFWKIVKDSEISKGIFLIISIESISQLYQLADRYFLNHVDEGGISALSYAQNFYLIFISIFSIALTTVLFPRLTKSLSENNIGELKDSVLKALKANLLIFTLIFSLLLFYAGDIINLIYERGKFTREDTLTTASVLQYFSISIIFYSSYSFFNKLIYAKKLHIFLLIVTIMGILLKFILNFILVGTLKQNGLALSTSLTHIFFFLTGLFITSKYIIKLNFNFFFTEFSFLITNAIICYIITALIFLIISDITIGQSFLKPVIFACIYILNLYFVRNITYLFLTNNLLSLINKNKTESL